nr:hypothetical protein [Tanacetum cinerariifolium]
MAESSSPDITSKEEPVNLDRPKSPNPFLPAIQGMSDFISKCCLKEAFTRASNQYKEYLGEFWYTEKVLPDSKIWVSTPTGEFRGEIGKKPGARSRLRRKQSSKHTSESTTEVSKSQSGHLKKETKSSLAMDTCPSHPLPPTPVVGEIHKEAQQVAGGPTSLGDTSEDEAYHQFSSGHDNSTDFTAQTDPGISAPKSHPSVLVDKTKSARDGLKTAHTTLSANEESGADDISRNVKLEYLTDILKDTRSTFFTPKSLTYEPIIVSDMSEEEENAKNNKDIEDTLSQKKELEQAKATAKVEVDLMKAKPSYPDINQLTKLLEKLKTLDSLPGLLKTVTNTLNKFATLVENASGAATTGVPSTDKVT